MDKELYREIRSDAAPQEVVINGRPYTKESLRPVFDPSPDAVEASTLTAIVDYLKVNLDKLDIKNLICHVVGPYEVVLQSTLGGTFQTRDRFVSLKAEIPIHNFGRWLDGEDFNIWLQSCFTEENYGDTDKSKMLQYIGNMKSEIVQSVGDDGISQGVTVRKGIASVADVVLPNPVRLAPYRTFCELEQPVSEFVFRACDGPQFKLVEADGGAWKMRAMQDIKAYFNMHLPELLVMA